MPTVLIDAPGRPQMRIHAPEGGSLADLCDDVNAPIPFSCRSANCGTCRVVVLAGGDQFAVAEDEELNVLDVFSNQPSRVRLACCAQVKAGPGTIHIRPVTDDE